MKADFGDRAFDLDAHVALMMEDGDPVPGPSTLDEIAADKANRDALPFLVDLTPPEEPALQWQASG